MFADSFASASSMMDALSALKQPFLIQEYIETKGVDTRAIVVGEKVVAAMHRESKKGEVRANIHAGGTGKPCVLDSETKKNCC
jgi:ribosomal protein S6--L-glutamate ligase